MPSLSDFTLFGTHCLPFQESVSADRFSKNKSVNSIVPFAPACLPTLNTTCVKPTLYAHLMAS